MKTVKEIRNDLANIKYYYTRKTVLDSAFENIGTNQIVELVAKYNKAICKAGPQLYDVYVSLYVKGASQEDAGEQLFYTTEYISKLNTKVISFFQKNIE